MLKKIEQRVNQRVSPILGQDQMDRFAVIIPLVKQQDGSLAVLFETRAKTLKRQPGEVSFPGGRIEATDSDAVEAAVRETSEELGIPQDDIRVIGELGAYVHFQKSVIFPIIAELNSAEYALNEAEVEDIFFVPLSFLLSNPPQKFQINIKSQPEDNFPFHLIPEGKNYPFRFRKVEEYFYLYHDRVIWGMTARILYFFLTLLKD